MKSNNNNLKIRTKEFRLTARDLVNKLTGQTPLIEEYNDAIMTISYASDASESAEFKKKTTAVLESVQEEKWYSEGHSIIIDGFNPYKPLQKKKLREKIAVLQKAIKELGISR